MSGNYPNPFNSQTVIEYRIQAASDVELTVYDMNGRPVRALARGVKPAGFHPVHWDGTDDGGRAAASGIYYCRIQIKGKAVGGISFRAGRKMILIR